MNIYQKIKSLLQWHGCHLLTIQVILQITAYNNSVITVTMTQQYNAMIFFFCSEKYLQNLLQIEMLLKMWFPQKAFTSTDTPNKTTTPRVASHWRQNQLHMPVKVSSLLDDSVI